MDPDYYIGLMSGTSFDGIDAVIASFDNRAVTIHAHHTHRFPLSLRDRLNSLSNASLAHPLQEVYSLDAELGHLYAQTIHDLIAGSSLPKQSIKAVGSHGQTIRHFPNNTPCFTVQIGDPNIIAAQTGITTVADFRRRDLAHGGQGAPLAPAFHHHFFHSPSENRAVLNIGGFANVTLLPASGRVVGFDTGPGNCLMDAWAQQHLHQPFDKNGEWAATGQVNSTLLNALLAHPFFAQHPPKSTGRDEFNVQWLALLLKDFSGLSPQDIQATLAELTAVSIARAIEDVSTVYLCGGGAFNTYLVSRLAAQLPSVSVMTTESLGLAPQLMESCLIAWLASRTLNKEPIDLSAITGSRQPAILGGVYFV